MTQPHIEAAARAICEADGLVWEDMTDPLKNASGGDNDQLQYIDHATLVWNLARKATLEEAAKAMRDEIEDQGFSAGELWIADRIEKRLRALSVEG